MSKDALEHLVPLTDGWTAWSWVWVRGAGFPADLALQLATEKSAAIAARLAEVEAAEEEARRAAVAACEAALAAARGAESGALARALKQLRAGREVDARGLPEEEWSAAARLAEQSRLRAELRGELGGELTAERTAAMAHMQELVRRGPMREALVWQNRRLVRGTVDAFLRRPPERDDSKMREYGRVLATYVQRYCVRNDTIGFFGPVGWARFTDAADAVVARPAEELVAERKVFFEHWAVDALAGRLAADPSLRVHLAPRRTPSVRLDGPVLRYGIGRSAELPAVFVRVMDACDGEASAAVVAARVLCEPTDSLSGVAEVMDVIEELAAVHLVTWTLELPTGQPHPERTLRGLLKRVRAPAARGPAMAALEQLEGARDAVARAAGDASRLEGAMDSLDATFTELTGAEPTRRVGQSHAGRGIVYEDCRRAGEIELGAPLRARLAGPLSLVLASARWFTYEIGRRYRALFGQVHAELSAELGHSRIELTRFKDRVDSAPGSLGRRGAGHRARRGRRAVRALDGHPGPGRPAGGAPHLRRAARAGGGGVPRAAPGLAERALPLTRPAHRGGRDRWAGPRRLPDCRRRDPHRRQHAAHSRRARAAPGARRPGARPRAGRAGAGHHAGRGRGARQPGRQLPGRAARLPRRDRRHPLVAAARSGAGHRRPVHRAGGGPAGGVELRRAPRVRRGRVLRAGPDLRMQRAVPPGVGRRPHAARRHRRPGGGARNSGASSRTRSSSPAAPRRSIA